MSKPRPTSKFIWGLAVFILAWGIAGGLLLSKMEKNSEAKRINALQMVSLGVAVRAYREAYGVNPSGSNSEVLKILLGNNPQNIKVLKLGTPAPLNDKGEFLDPWQTPYQIQVTTNAVLIRSAGKNKTFGDSDDVVSDEPLK